jgi:outer membrane protein OmpA-like peptidoglycan-associated protein
MSTRNLPGLVVLALVALAAPASAIFNSPTLLFDTPTADVLPAGVLTISADVTGPLTQTSRNVPYWEGNANVRFSPFRNFDFAVTAYTLKDYVLDLRYRLVGGEPDRFALALGIYDIGFNKYVSPLGHGLDAAWPDWQYDKSKEWYNRPMENFSAFAVASIPLASFIRLHLGLGRGRFVGYDGPNQYMNTDEFTRQFHEWAVALFGGVQVFIAPDVALVAEANTRDFNSGVEANFGPFTAIAAWTKMEGLLRATKGAEFGRVELGASYKLDLRRPEPPPSAPTPTTPLPEPPPPPVATLIPDKPGLIPIWFGWDKSDITAIAEATLRKNAEVLLAHPDMKIIITGYASEDGSPEHNLPLSGRRAQAAFEFLKSMGVPAGQMRYQAKGESEGRPLPMHRSVYFSLESEK